MQLFLDILFARVNLAIVLLLCAIYILRKIIIKHFGINGGFLQKKYRFLQEHHKFLGLLAIIFGLIHGIFSSGEVISLNLGTVCWVLLILLAISWFVRVKFKKKWLYYHRGLAGLFIGILFFHIIEVGGFTSDFLSLYQAKKPIPDSSNLNTNIIEPRIPSNLTSKKFVDGIYTGTATGYQPGLVVQVTITGGAIASIAIVSHNERGPEHYSYAMKHVPDAIIKNQSTDVDGISGATKTSNGIKNAVNDALIKAVGQ
ncbi:MAG: putative FMN-binding domain protein [Firmicutes bacterium]|nr:putative FMN-binding domain protein [Bacillota bacterium]